MCCPELIIYSSALFPQSHIYIVLLAVVEQYIAVYSLIFIRTTECNIRKDKLCIISFTKEPMFDWLILSVSRIAAGNGGIISP